jgi:polysaccharide biosynthesis protein PslG
MLTLRFRPLALLLTSALLLPLLLPARVSASAPLPAFGAQSHALWGSQTDAERLATLDAVAASGMGWIRLDIGWCTLEETGRGQTAPWYLARADFVVDAARDRGLQVLATLWCTPEWANGGQSRNVPPTDVNEYARYAEIIATHFRGRVAAWEVWNEPNLSGFWSTKDPVGYTALLRAAYPAFKAGDPAADVVFGGPSYNDYAWIDQAYRAGAKDSFDVMATHPYVSPSDQGPTYAYRDKRYTVPAVALVRDTMVRYGDSHKPIWFTEFGWSAHDNTGSEPAWQLGVTREQQATYLTEMVHAVRDHYPYVTHVFWYNARDKDPAKSSVHEAGYGLLQRELTPKPAYAAVQALYGSGSGLEPTPPGDPVPAPVPGPAPAMTLSATVTAASKNHSQVRLAWTRNEAATVEILRNDGVIATGRDGIHDDRVRRDRTYTYQVCDSGRLRCSPEVTVRS